MKRSKTSEYLINALLRLLILVILFAISMGIGTQYFAYRLGFQEVLGTKFFGCIYMPWKILVWRYSEWGHLPEFESLFQTSFGFIILFLVLVFGVYIFIHVSHQKRKKSHLHGSARYASKKDIQAANLVMVRHNSEDIKKHDGVYVGGWDDALGRRYDLVHNGPEHCMMVAPTRAGKGVSIVIPTLLFWRQSVVVLDLKGELWESSAGWRKDYLKSTCIKFEPAASYGSAKWNPLDEVRLGTEHEVGDVQNISTLVVDPDGKGFIDHWQKTAFALLNGCILHLLYLRENNDVKSATLADLDAMLSNPKQPVIKLWEQMITYQHYNGKTHTVVARAGQDMIDRPEEEAGSVLSTVKSYFALYRDPVVAKNTSDSNFCIHDIMNSKKPVSLYIVTQPSNKTRLKPLIRLFISMVLHIQTSSLGGYKWRELMMLDEFPSLGKLEIFQEALAFIAGYGIKVYIICQDLSQLRSKESGYGSDESISSNCHVQNYFQPNRLETAEYVSKLTGTKTEEEEQTNYSGKRFGILSSTSKSVQKVARPLKTPDEVLRLQGPIKNRENKIVKPGKMLMFVSGFPCIEGTQPLFFQNKYFSLRESLPAPKESDIIRSSRERPVIKDALPKKGSIEMVNPDISEVEAKFTNGDIRKNISPQSSGLESNVENQEIKIKGREAV